MDELIERAKKVKRQNEDEWLSISEVVSIGIGYVQNDTLGIIIGVKGNVETLSDKFPEKIDKIPISVKSVREIRAL
ncbi:MAG: hypothetical protein H6627_11995 [Calditrichae bacterium]|nr:hypothetical protein [Calditrichota bacterium]MCB9059282.1 hypothetical protein [Calditrichia bacterium]